jgi:hypothetical protein
LASRKGSCLVARVTCWIIASQLRDSLDHFVLFINVQCAELNELAAPRTRTFTSECYWYSLSPGGSRAHERTHQTTLKNGARNTLSIVARSIRGDLVGKTLHELFANGKETIGSCSRIFSGGAT